jgi:hypothetical protein
LYVDDDNHEVKDPDHNGSDHAHDDHDQSEAAAKTDHDHAEAGHEDHDHGHAEAGHDDHGSHAEAGDLSMTEQLQVNMEKHLDVGHLMGHVQDAYYFDCPKALGFSFTDEEGHEHNGIPIPNITGFTKETPMIGTAQSPIFIGRLSKFMVLELVAAILLTLVFVWLGKKIKSGDRPKGKVWNLLETFVVYIRDEVVKPSVGEHDYEFIRCDSLLGISNWIFGRHCCISVDNLRHCRGIWYPKNGIRRIPQGTGAEHGFAAGNEGGPVALDVCY